MSLKSTITYRDRGCLFFIALLFFCSCSNQTDREITDNYSVLKINNESLRDTMDLSKMIASVKVLKLTDSAKKPLANITQLYSLGDYYIALDAINTKRVNAYTKDGNYVMTLMENGPLKTDALNVTDCYVNEKNEVILYDYARMKLTIYNSNLKLKKTIQGKTMFNYHRIASLPGTDNFVAYSSYYGYNAELQKDYNHPSSLDILSDQLSLSQKHLFYPPKYKDITLITLPKTFFPLQDSVRFFRAYDPYIYSLNKNGMERRYKIDYAKGNIPPDFLEKIVKPNLQVFKTIGRSPSSYQALFSNFKGYTSLKNWIETDHMMYLSSMTFSDKTTTDFNSIILKKGGIPTVLSASVFADSVNFKLTFPNFNTYDKKRNEFVAYCTGNRLKKHLYKNSSIIKPEDIVDDSFYLIRVKFKQD